MSRTRWSRGRGSRSRWARPPSRARARPAPASRTGPGRWGSRCRTGCTGSATVRSTMTELQTTWVRRSCEGVRDRERGVDAGAHRTRARPRRGRPARGRPSPPPWSRARGSDRSVAGDVLGPRLLGRADLLRALSPHSEGVASRTTEGGLPRFPSRVAHVRLLSMNGTQIPTAPLGLTGDWNHAGPADWAEVLAGFPLFAGIAKRRLRGLARQATLAEYSRGDIVLQKGEPGDSLYVILSGSAKARGKPGARTLRTGDYFGELGLLNGVPRSATVVATGELHVMKLQRERLPPNRAARAVDLAGAGEQARVADPAAGSSGCLSDAENQLQITHAEPWPRAPFAPRTTSPGTGSPASSRSSAGTISDRRLASASTRSTYARAWR